MKHDNRQGELQYHLIQAEMASYLSVCMYYADIQIPTYFQINLEFICFISPLQPYYCILTIIKNRNHQGELQYQISQ